MRGQYGSHEWSRTRAEKTSGEAPVVGHKRTDAVMRLLQGESLDQLSRELRGTLIGWRLGTTLHRGREGSRAAYGATLADRRLSVAARAT